MSHIVDKTESVNDFTAVKISLADPKKIRDGSYGEVKKPETVNYRSYKSERDGLFCERIFGPEKDWECTCGRYKGMKYKGMTCERCGVKITHSRERRKRMGHIELAAPVVHIWFFRAVQSKLATLLAMKATALEKVVYFQEYVVIDGGETPLKVGELLDEEKYRNYRKDYGKDAFKAGMGAEAIRDLLRALDLASLSNELRQQIKATNSAATKKQLNSRLKLVESLCNCQGENKPEWMVLEVIPVIPPDLRPLVQLDSGTFATSDLNDLYRRIINRNNRLGKLTLLNAPDVIIRNEKRMLQQSVDALFDNGRCKRKVQGSNGRALKSLTDMIKGKQGRFRENLLGKRVDYSARSVIVVGPHLRLHQCGLPKPIALELYQPFIIRKLKELKRADTIKSAKKMLERRDPEVWDVLEDVVKNHPVLLNRAPTLHRMGIQAFEPILVEGNAINLHPFVCKGFNADFDGDQMAVHLPLSLEAQVESYTLMLSTNNIFSPASGEPIMMPQQDVVMGCYYITYEQPGMDGEGMVFSSFDECLLAHSLGKVDLQAKIKVRMPKGRFLKGNPSVREGKLFETTPGRIIFNQILDDGPFYNYPLGSKELAGVISDCYELNGRKVTINLLDKMMRLGFEEGTKSGLSFAADDLLTPPEKKAMLAEGDKEVQLLAQRLERGEITEDGCYEQTIDLWEKTNKEIGKKLEETFANDVYRETPDPNATKIRPRGYVNPVYLMAKSGARGNMGQIRQLAGMRGLMARPNGKIIETPVKANFLEGLTVFEYFTTTHAARKGLSDTALKTADSGYLTRKLADVSQNCVVTMLDCGTAEGVRKQVLQDGDKKIPLSKSIVGRVSCESVVDPITDETIVKANELITIEIARKIDEIGVDTLTVRSPMTCQAEMGVCAHCYGMDLSTSLLVEEGLAVGIIAAQSIGEPGTQLTMRTFHSGGVASRSVKETEIKTEFSGKIRIKGMELGPHVATANGEDSSLVLGSDHQGGVQITNSRGQARETYRIPNGAYLLVKDGDMVKKDDVIAKVDAHNKLVIAMTDGVQVCFIDLDESTVNTVEDKASGAKFREIGDLRGDSHPRIDLIQTLGGRVVESYQLPSGSQLLVDDGDYVNKGTILAKTPFSGGGSEDITSGLPRVTEIFEARAPKDPAIVSETSGVVHISEERKRGKQEVYVYERGDDYRCGSVYAIPQNKRLLVYEGNEVLKGQPLTDGQINPKDILRTQGAEAVQDYLIAEVQKVYRAQGVPINDKHIEIIISQMLRRYKIEKAGDSGFIVGDVVDRSEYKRRNNEMRESVKIVSPGSTNFQKDDVVSREDFNATNAKYAAIDPQATLATCKPCDLAEGKVQLNGIARAALMSDSFLSAASFQETTKILTEAALACKRDNLIGLKENVIVGRLIPAGTGFDLYQGAMCTTRQGVEPIGHAPKFESDFSFLDNNPANDFVAQDDVDKGAAFLAVGDSVDADSIDDGATFESIDGAFEEVPDMETELDEAALAEYANFMTDGSPADFITAEEDEGEEPRLLGDDEEF